MLLYYCYDIIVMILMSVTKISIPNTVVIHYYAWYTYFCNGRYCYDIIVMIILLCIM